MKILYIIIFSCSWLLFEACNSNSGNNTSAIVAPAAGQKIFPLSIQKGGAFSSLDQIRVQALSIIDHRIRTEPDPLSMITSPFWNPEFVFNGAEMSKENEYEGYWLKFEDDFSYAYGVYKNTHGTGRYHFQIDEPTLIMLDDNIELEPKVWKVNHNADVIALVGTHEYGVNNGMQIKMIGLPKKPEK